MQSDVQFDGEIQFGLVIVCSALDLLVPRHQSSEMLHFKWTVVNLPLSEESIFKPPFVIFT